MPQCLLLIEGMGTKGKLTIRNAVSRHFLAKQLSVAGQRVQKALVLGLYRNCECHVNGTL